MFHISKYMSTWMCECICGCTVCVCVWRTDRRFIIHCRELTSLFLFHPEMRKTFQTWHCLIEDDGSVCVCVRVSMCEPLSVCFCAQVWVFVCASLLVYSRLLLFWNVCNGYQVSASDATHSHKHSHSMCLCWQQSVKRWRTAGDLWGRQRSWKTFGQRPVVKQTQRWSSYRLLWSWAEWGCWVGRHPSVCTPALAACTLCIF